MGKEMKKIRNKMGRKKRKQRKNMERNRKRNGNGNREKIKNIREKMGEK